MLARCSLRINYFILTTILPYYNNLYTHTVAARSINSRRVTSLTERWISRFLIAYVEGRSELTIFGCDARKFIIAYISIQATDQPSLLNGGSHRY